MRPLHFFNSNPRIDALAADARAWLGTPFFPHAASLGHGVDCVNLVHELLSGAGAIPRVVLPDYALDRAKHAGGSQLLTFLLTHPDLAGRFELVPFGHLRRPGDLLGLLCGRADHHLALVMPFAQCIHAVDTVGVVMADLADPRIEDRVVYVLRPLEIRA